jgi:hypothetical protein
MPTGACGINCDVCRLKSKGICAGCDAGTAFQPEAVADHKCPVLQCAVRKQVAYCISDCAEFPCAVLSKGQYPYSGAYLGMHKQRFATIRT